MEGVLQRWLSLIYELTKMRMRTLTDVGGLRFLKWNFCLFNTEKWGTIKS